MPRRRLWRNWNPTNRRTTANACARVRYRWKPEGPLSAAVGWYEDATVFEADMAYTRKCSSRWPIRWRMLADS
jgi:hypothetical protein